MAGLALFALAMAHQSPRPKLAFHPSAELSRPRIGLGDIADLSALPPPLRRQAASLVVAAFRPGQRELSLAGAPLEARLRALLPALGAYLPPPASIAIRLRYMPAASPTTPLQCRSLAADVAAGAAILASDLAASPCVGVAGGAILYDRGNGLARARRNLRAGEIVGAVPESALAEVRPHDVFYLSASVGPVKIERRVEALQAGRRGGRVFVRGLAGAAFSAPIPGDGR